MAFVLHHAVGRVSGGFQISKNPFVHRQVLLTVLVSGFSTEAFNQSVSAVEISTMK